MDLPARLAAGEPITEPVLLVVGHPDDETVSLGAALPRFADLTILHLTGGAPRDGVDARRHGFARVDDYAAARRCELDEALRSLGVAPRRIALGLPDQEALGGLPAILDVLRAELPRHRAVLTHPYEHGHPDHDTAALAVALATREADINYVEFASYHRGPDGDVFGRFWPDLASPEVELPIDAAALERKAAALSCFRTQQGTLALLPLAPERLRRAPAYDFAAAAPPGEAWYDRFGWATTAERWRSEVAELLRAAAEPA